MAWTTPRTWTDGELVNKIIMDAHVRDNLNLLKTSINDDGSLRAFGLLDRVFTEQVVSNTNVETSVYSYSITGGTFSTNNIVRLVLTGYIDLSATSANLTLRVKFGSVTIGTGVIAATASTKGGVHLEVIINANNATNSQRSICTVQHVLNNAALTDGNFDTGPSTVRVAAYSSLAEDTTTAKTLEVTAQWGNTATTSIFKRWAAWTEKLKAI